MHSIETYLHTWNPPSPSHLQRLKIEDDSLRDGLQAAFVRKPTVAQKIELLSASAAVGTQAVMLGFPASSSAEFAQCQALLNHIETENLHLIPRFLARSVIADLEPIVQLNQQSRVEVWADFLINPSPLREYVEGWDFAVMLEKNRQASEYLRQQKVHFGVSIEDATRTPPPRLQQAIETALDCGAEVLTLCDTVGAANPAGAARLVTFSREQVKKHKTRRHKIELWWHGHNDLGLSLANAIAAAEAGVEGISGSFLGIGERTGNTPLEQLLMYLYQQGHRGFKLNKMEHYCRQLATYTDTKIPANQPLFGEQAFATCTGTHAAAIGKAHRLGREFEDLIFSAVPASLLEKEQTILLGPTSGSANAKQVLEAAGIEVNEENIAKALQIARGLDTWLTGQQLLTMF